MRKLNLSGTFSYFEKLKKRGHCEKDLTVLKGISMKLLSIVVPSYNSQDYLNKAIESVTDLNDARIELLVVDDGSKDETFAVAKTLSSAISRYYRCDSSRE